MNIPIRILVTGGTFDKEYDEIHGRLDFAQTHVPEMLKLGRCNLDIDVRTIMMIDSLEMTDADRDIILHACKHADENNIIVTHGTDTMPETAQYLAERLTDKTVILTGAMIPYKFGSSDGFFNLGASIAFVQTLSPGIYVCMNGRVYNWDNVKKNKKTGFFEELSQQ